MAYFSNGTEGELYNVQYCDHCIHGGDCAVWDAHMWHNYDECNNNASILDILIPRDKTRNEKCRMFTDKNPDRCKETKDMFAQPKGGDK